MPRYAEIVVKGHVNMPNGSSKPVVNVYGYGLAADVPGASKASLFAVFDTFVLTPMRLALNQAYIGDDVQIRWLDDATNPYTLVGAPGNGARPGDQYSLQSAVYIGLKSGSRGRSGKGSKHYGPISESDTTGNEIDGTAITRFTDLAQGCVATLGDIDGNDWMPMVISRKPPAQYSTNPTNVVAAPIIGYVLNKTIGTMRRRKERTNSIYSLAPAVTSVVPNTGVAAGGTLVAINGTNFTGATSVSFGATPATAFTVSSPILISATSPAHAAGAVDVVVGNTYGTSPVVAGDVFTYT